MIFGKHDDKTLAQLADVAEDAERVALMADGHLGYIMPIGGVAAFDNKVMVSGVGFDIACGNAAILTDLTLPDLGLDATIEDIRRNPSIVRCREIGDLATEIEHVISFGMGGVNFSKDAPKDHPLFHDVRWHLIPNEGGFRDDLREKARRQLGTVGSGNHYVDVFVDTRNRIWVGVHFGSRGFGHTVASSFLALAEGKRWGERVKESKALLSLNTLLGTDYFALMELAGRYAYAGREWAARKVVEILGGKELDLVHNHHNFAWKETHGDRQYVVVRKGATPAFPGQRGFIGGSMGDDAVIVRGSERETELQKAALFSTVHGAGRVMSRTEARGKVNRKTGEVKKRGKVTRHMMDSWLEAAGVILRGGGLDESPHAYRRLPEVLRAQGDTIDVLETLKPIIVVMAGAGR